MGDETKRRPVRSGDGSIAQLAAVLDAQRRVAAVAEDEAHAGRVAVAAGDGGVELAARAAGGGDELAGREDALGDAHGVAGRNVLAREDCALAGVEALAGIHLAVRVDIDLDLRAD